MSRSNAVYQYPDAPLNRSIVERIKRLHQTETDESKDSAEELLKNIYHIENDMEELGVDAIYLQPHEILYVDRYLDLLSTTEKIDQYRKEGFNEKQIEQIRAGLEDGIDVSVYAYIDQSADRMKMIRYLLTGEKLDQDAFYYTKYFDDLNMAHVQVVSFVEEQQSEYEDMEL